MEIDLSQFGVNNLLYFYTDIKDNEFLYPQVFGFEKCHKNKEKIVWSKNSFAIHFVIGGKGRVGKENVKAGDIFVLPPNSNISYCPNKNDPYQYIWIEYAGFLAKSYTVKAGFNIDEENLVCTLENFNEIIEKLISMLNEIKSITNVKAQKMYYESILLGVLSLITQKYGYNTDFSKKKTSQEIKIEEIIQFIHTNYPNPELDVQMISEKFFFVPSYITRIMKNYVGMGPNKYINKVRMERALDLLESKEYTIEQISSSVGFKTQFYFSRKFKEYYGYPPSIKKSKN